MSTKRQLDISEDAYFLNLFPSEEQAVCTIHQARTMRCPFCQDEYVHWEDPVVIPGTDEKEEPAGVPAWLTEDRGWVRTGSIVIPFWCEHSHQWAMQFGFHKGQTYLRIIIGPQRPSLTEVEQALLTLDRLGRVRGGG